MAGRRKQKKSPTKGPPHFRGPRAPPRVAFRARRGCFGRSFPSPGPIGTRGAFARQGSFAVVGTSDLRTEKKHQKRAFFSPHLAQKVGSKNAGVGGAPLVARRGGGCFCLFLAAPPHRPTPPTPPFFPRIRRAGMGVVTTWDQKHKTNSQKQRPSLAPRPATPLEHNVHNTRRHNSNDNHDDDDDDDVSRRGSTDIYILTGCMRGTCRSTLFCYAYLFFLFWFKSGGGGGASSGGAWGRDPSTQGESAPGRKRIQRNR